MNVMKKTNKDIRQLTPTLLKRIIAEEKKYVKKLILKERKRINKIKKQKLLENIAKKQKSLVKKFKLLYTFKSKLNKGG
jgi:hypothetical protein